MLQRDRDILDSLETFRVLSRDQIIDLHFKSVNSSIQVCSRTMRRLIKKGYVVANEDVRPYDYYLNPPPIQKKSIKTLHFKAITDFYIELCRWEKPTLFEVEYTVLGGRTMVRPDVFMLWKNTPFFVEVQRTPQSEKLMLEKYEQYAKYYESWLWQKEHWQPKDKNKEPVFPYIWLYTSKYYSFPEEPVRILQSKTCRDFIYRYTK